MPRYFLDFDDGDSLTRDMVGREFADVSAVRAAAIDGLLDTVRDKLPDGERRTFAAIVRDADGVCVHTARFDYRAEDFYRPEDFYRAEDFGLEADRDALDSLLDAMMRAHALSRYENDPVLQAMIERVILQIGIRIAGSIGLRAGYALLN